MVLELERVVVLVVVVVVVVVVLLVVVLVVVLVTIWGVVEAAVVVWQFAIFRKKEIQFFIWN